MSRSGSLPGSKNLPGRSSVQLELFPPTSASASPPPSLVGRPPLDLTVLPLLTNAQIEWAFEGAFERIRAGIAQRTLSPTSAELAAPVGTPPSRTLNTARTDPFATLPWRI